METAFYCVSSGAYFIGAVALVNSLRLMGHGDPIFVLDSGLEERQRDLLAPEATVVPGPAGETPFALKTIAPLQHPAEVTVLIDADVIITRPLTELIDEARQGRLLAVEHGQDRFFEEWEAPLGHSARHRTYVSSSLVFMGGEVGSTVIRRMDEMQRRIDLARSPYANALPELAEVRRGHSKAGAEDPFFFADQDVLNAVLATEIDHERVSVLDRRLEAIMPFTGLEVRDVEALRCVYEDGFEPSAVHHYLPVKPWLEPTPPGVYTQLLTRLLHGDDVAVRVPDRDLPPHLRTGLLASARRWSRGIRRG